MSISISQSRPIFSFDTLVRMLGGMWFLLLAGVVLWHINLMEPIVALPRIILSLFYAILAVLLFVRPPALSQTDRVSVKVAAFFGTYMPWTIGFFPRNDSAILGVISMVCLIVGLSLAIFTVLHLGKAFSLVPQARTVVSSGPYRWLRHPLYLSEEIAIVGTLLQFLSPLTVTIIGLHVALQVCRIRTEEQLLRQTFPAYRHYEARTWRVIPFVW